MEDILENNIIDNTNCKNIIISPVSKSSKTIKESHKIIKPRVITLSKNWNIQTQYYDPTLQWNCLFNSNFHLSNSEFVDQDGQASIRAPHVVLKPGSLGLQTMISEDTENMEENVRNQAKKQIIIKIGGYRSQDVKKKLFDNTKFVNLEYVMELLEKSHMKCYYCKEITKVLYEHVREPRQWTLDRIENNQGHNISNVMIACLQCNLRRRCMYHERYVFTKQLKIVRSDLS
jgi:hypothetical protein